MIERMQAQLDELRAHLGAIQNGDVSSKRRTGARLGWADMSPEERSVEMLRRQKVAAANRAAADRLIPRDKNHPNHAKWAAQQRKQQQKQWNAKTPAQKAKWLKAINAGKKRKQIEAAAVA